MNNLLRFFATAALVSVFGAGQVETVSVTDPASAVPVLRKAVVPVLLPTLVPKDFGKVYLTPRVGAPWTTRGGYTAYIGFIADCDGGACTAATVTGEYGRLGVMPSTAKQVVLPHGGEAYYIESACGANCGGSAVLKFVRGAVRYEITIKAGTLDEALAIERGLQPLSAVH